MARTPEITTSSFRPLNLDEIMMVPLAKQAQEDQAVLELDELSKLEANALDADKKYVSGQIAAFQKEAGALSDQLINQGVDRNLLNKAKTLRRRKNQEFSLQGKTGQAAAAYNQYEANKKAIMARKDLTATQKELGLAKALSDYTGVVEGGQYQDYIGTAYQDVMKKGRDIAASMTPEQKAGMLGMKIDENGYFRDGKYVYKKLTADHIARVVKQALESDQGVMDYLNEVESLDPSQNADQILTDAAISAGNVGQVSSDSETWSLLPANMQTNVIDSTKGMIDRESQPWSVMKIYNQEGLWDSSFNMPTKEAAQGWFVNGQLPDELPEYDEEREAKIKKERDIIKKLPVSWKEKSMKLAAYDLRNPSYSVLSREQRGLKESLNTLRENFPVLEGINPKTNVPYSDQEIFEIYSNGAKLAEQSYSDVVIPLNPKNSFVEIGNTLLGEEGRPGTFAQKNMKVAGMPEGASKDVVADKMGLSTEELMRVVEKGTVLGFAPGHVDMPGAFAVQVEIDGETPVIYIENNGKATEIMKPVSWMNEAIKSGKNYSLHKSRSASGGINNEHVITELSPATGKYEAAIIRSKTEYTKDELDQLSFMAHPQNPSILVAVDDEGTPVKPYVVKTMYQDELQRATDMTTALYDKTPNASQTLSKGQKN